MQDEYNGIKYTIKPSVHMHKKYDVFVNQKYLVSFGDKRYEQYFDKIGFYRSKDHNNEKRRQLYYKRHGEAGLPFTAKWFSHRYLW